MTWKRPWGKVPSNGRSDRSADGAGRGHGKPRAGGPGIASGQSVGARSEQQDNYWTSGPQRTGEGDPETLAVIADGMGGHRGGRQAGLAAVLGFRAGFYGETEDSKKLQAGVKEANLAVRASQDADGYEPGGTGTTLIGLRIRGHQIEWTSIGDSRLLLVDEQGVEQLNEDHSMKPVIEEATRRNPGEPSKLNPHELRSAVAGVQIDLIDTGRRQIPEGNTTLILATDGIDTLSDPEIQAVSVAAAPKGPEEVVRRLLQHVGDRDKPRQDNTTVVAMRWTSGRKQTAVAASAIRQMENALAPTVVADRNQPVLTLRETRRRMRKRNAGWRAAFVWALLAATGQEAGAGQEDQATTAARIESERKVAEAAASLENAEAAMAEAVEASRRARAATEAAEQDLERLLASGGTGTAALTEAQERLARLEARQAATTEERDRLAAELNRARAERLAREEELEAVQAEAEAAREAAAASAAAAAEADEAARQATAEAEAARAAGEEADARTAELERRRTIEMRYWLAVIAALLIAAAAVWSWGRRRNTERAAEQEEAHQNAVAEHEAKERFLQSQLQGAMKPADHALLLEGRKADGGAVALKITREQLGAAGQVLIGRNAHDVDTVIDDPEVSRKHLLLIDDSEGLQIEDLGSTNGTFVNGRQLNRGERIRISPSDEVGVGRAVVFRVQTEQQG